jgi:hypothetical protein
MSRFLPHPYLLLVLITLQIAAWARQPLSIFQATRRDKPVVVDGRLDEPIWKTAQLLTQFTQIEPYNLKPASFQTSVWVLYDDLGIYIGARIDDPHPDSLIKDLRKRDDFGLADAFGLKIDPYCDGLNAYGFFVTVRGVQIDSKTNADNEDDFNWDAVWRSAVQIDEAGWTAEMMIPYSALRFPKAEVQQWNVNFFRSVQRYREISSWHPVDASQKSQNRQMGRMELLSAIEPPIRMSATPYIAAGATHSGKKKQWSGAYNMGMDVKIGLSESFTLDMTLIPDFGQVESDQYIYSLSPFEVYYEEKRPFFTEGTELFSKGNVLYSRRIGGRPKKFATIASEYPPDSILRNPESIQLINASKLTGKTSGGLAIGVFNAITAPAHAEVLMPGGQQHSITTEPTTNYNMIVLEQALPNNSQASFFNTHVWRHEWQQSAFVTGAESALRNKNNSLEWYGMASVSHYTMSAEPGLAGSRYLTSFGKINGRFRPSVWVNIVSDRFDPNEMGFLRNNNEMNTGIELNYNEFEPKGKLLKWSVRGKINQNYQYHPQAYVSTYLQADCRFTLQNHLTIGGYLNSLPFGKTDYFEARAKGIPFLKPAEYSAGFWGSPNYQKRIIADYRVNYSFVPNWNGQNINLRLSPRWRINDQAILISTVSHERQTNNRGYVREWCDGSNNRIIFGNRNINSTSGSIAFDFSFSANTSLMLRMRHYVLQVDYNHFYNLAPDGKLQESDYLADEDFVVNNLNVDLLFRWNFLPGSELLLIWKQAVNEHKSGREFLSGYFHHLAEMGQISGNNNLSFKLLYYIDWNQIKQVKGKA